MSSYQPPADDQELIKYLAELFSEMDAASPGELDNFIRELGFDPDQISARAADVAARASRQSPSNWRNRARAGLEQEKQHLSQIGSELTAGQPRESIIGAIETLAQKLGAGSGLQVAGVQHRNLDEASEQDLLTLLAELQYLADQRNRIDDESEPG